MDAANQQCVQYMLPKWENRLGKAQEKNFGKTHCFARFKARRINHNIHTCCKIVMLSP